MRAKTKLAEKLSGGGFSLTAECLPPRGMDTAAIKQFAVAVSGIVDAVVVAEDRGEIRSSAMSCAVLLLNERVEPVLSMDTRDKNRIALESDVLGATALGIRNFLCITGAHQSLGARPAAVSCYDLDDYQFSRAMARMADSGTDFSGKPLDSAPDLFVAAAVHPAMRPIELALLGLRKSIAAGARAVLTDRVVDLGAFETWMTAVRSAGLDQQIPIIAAVGPEDIEIGHKLRSVQGVRGIHVSNFGDLASTVRFFKEAGLA